MSIYGSSRTPVDIHGLGATLICNFENPDEIYRTIYEVEPDQIIHLAGCSDASAPDKMLQTNILGTWHMLEACRRMKNPVDILLVGSAASFGEMNDSESGLSASRACNPSSLYGLSRHAQLELGRIANNDKGVRVFLCRTFNLIGPGISERYVPAALANRIRAASEEGIVELEVRNMDDIRDFVDVRDAVSAYFEIIRSGQPGYAYSVGCGKAVAIGELAELLSQRMNKRMKFIAIASDASRLRSSIKRSVADPTDLKEHTGWSPKWTLQESISDMLHQLAIRK